MALTSQINRAAATQKPPVGTQTIDSRYVDNIPDATPERWRDFGISVADHVLAANAPTFIMAFADVRHAFAGHDCQLSHSKNVRVCEHPDHERDAKALNEALIVLGVAHDPYPSGTKRARAHTATRSRSTCPVCAKRWNTLRDGTVGKHPPLGSSTGDCLGYGRRPAGEVAA